MKVIMFKKQIKARVRVALKTARPMFGVPNLMRTQFTTKVFRKNETVFASVHPGEDGKTAQLTLLDDKNFAPVGIMYAVNLTMFKEVV